jgi:hypothetical protein
MGRHGNHTARSFSQKFAEGMTWQGKDIISIIFCSLLKNEMRGLVVRHS